MSLDTNETNDNDDLCDLCMRSGVTISHTNGDGDTVCTDCADDEEPNRFVLFLADLNEPTCWDDGGLVTFATEKEAASEAADCMIEYWKQVQLGERAIEEVPEPEYIVPVTMLPDGGFSTSAHGVWTIEQLNQLRS